MRGVGRRASSEEEQRGRRGNDLARARARVVYARSLTQPSVREGDDRVEFRVRERSKSSAGLGSHAGVQLVASASQARITSSPGPLVGSDLGSFFPLDLSSNIL